MVVWEQRAAFALYSMDRSFERVIHIWNSIVAEDEPAIYLFHVLFCP